MTFHARSAAFRITRHTRLRPGFFRQLTAAIRSRDRLNGPALGRTISASDHWDFTWNPPGGNFRSTPDTCINTEQVRRGQRFASLPLKK
jgi:hypothetical protein